MTFFHTDLLLTAARRVRSVMLAQSSSARIRDAYAERVRTREELKRLWTRFTLTNNTPYEPSLSNPPKENCVLVKKHRL
jgi:hypothetical protein